MNQQERKKEAGSCEKESRAHLAESKALLRLGRWHQPQHKRPDRRGVVFPRSSREGIRPLKSIRFLDSHLPILARAGSSNRHSPVTSPACKCVFDVRSNVSRQLSVSEILQFDRDSHSTAFYPQELRPFVVQTGQSHAGRACESFVNSHIHNLC